jgi:hypothetical protein
MVGQQQYLLTSCRSGRIRGAAQKGGKPNCIKPSVALLLLALHVQRIAAACLDIARDPGVERRDLKAVTPTPTPITYGRQGSFDRVGRDRDGRLRREPRWYADHVLLGCTPASWNTSGTSLPVGTRR